MKTEENKSDEAKVPVNTKDHDAAEVISITDPKKVDNSKESPDSHKPTATITGDSSLT